MNFRLILSGLWLQLLLAMLLLWTWPGTAAFRFADAFSPGCCAFPTKG